MTLAQIGAGIAIAVVVSSTVGGYYVMHDDVEDHEIAINGPDGLVEGVRLLRQLNTVQEAREDERAKAEDRRMREETEKSAINIRLCSEGGLPKAWCRSKGWFHPGGSN